MKTYNFLWLALAVNFVSVLFSLTLNADCISDLEIQQLKYHAKLNPQQVEKIVELAEQGDPAEGWQLLGTYGDPYAALAAQVLSNKKTRNGSFYNGLITYHWIQANGLEKTQNNFQSVAKQHFRQYVEIIRLTGNWPDSDQILMSYLKAVRDHHLKDITVFDAAWDAAGMNWYRPWQKLNHIESERIVYPTHVCFDIKSSEAKRIIRNDLLKALF